MNQVVHRALTCTSAWQVVMGRAMMNLDVLPGVKYGDYVFVFHPDLRGAEKAITALARELKFKNVYDLSCYVAKIYQLLSTRPLIPFLLCGRGIDAEIQELIKQIREKFNYVDFQKVFCISSKAYLEFEAVNILHGKEYQPIIDGFGNYLSRNSTTSSGGGIKKFLSIAERWTIYRLAGIRAAFFMPFLKKTFIKENGSYELARDPEKLGKYERQIAKILVEDPTLGSGLKIRGIIVGSTFSLNKRTFFPIDVEKRIYLKALEKMQREFGFSIEEIAFAAHPRFGKTNTKTVLKYLGCQLLRNKFGVLEFEISNPDLEVVYSFGSTVSINVKKYSDIQTFFLLSTELKSNWKYRNGLEEASKRFNIPIVEI